ncbi:MAG: PAS domain S-box protein [Rhodospirillales bacterium]|jgi:PAS domain S-box-containing protein|nr:PAS domain S-box protein [Rhodospirillales bacterium]
MKISTRIIALVLIGFFVTLTVAGVGVIATSRIADKLDTISRTDIPFVRTLAGAVFEQLEQEVALGTALRIGSLQKTDDAQAWEDFENASENFQDHSARVQNKLREATSIAQQALREINVEEGRQELRAAILSLHNISLTQSRQSGLAQKTLHLIETGKHADAARLIPNLEDQRRMMISEISNLIVRIENIARISAQAANQQRQTGLLIIVGVATIGIAVCVVLGLAIGRGITRPIASITNTLGELVRGNTEVPLDIARGESEIGAIAVALAAFRNEIIDRRKTVAALAESQRRFHALAEVSPVGVYYTDPDGIFLYVNEKACEISGLTPLEATSGGWSRSLHPDDSQRVSDEWRACVAADRPFRSEYRFLRSDETEIWALGQATSHKGAGGQIEGFVGTVSDISEHKRAEATLQEYARTRSNLHEIMAAPNIDLDDKIQRILELGTEVFQLPLGIVSRIDEGTYTVEHIIGPADAPPPGTTFLVDETFCVHVLSANGPVGFHRAGEDRRVRQHPCYKKFGLEGYIGSPLVVDGDHYGTLNFSSPTAREHPFSDGEYSLIQLFAQWIGTEISRQHSSEILRVSEERLKLALEGTEDGLWDLNLINGNIYTSPRAERMFGYEPDEMAWTLSSWQENIHPDDLEETLDAQSRHLQGKTPVYEMEYRVRSKSGEDVWILDRGKVVERSRSGRPLRAVGTYTDITARKRAEDALRDSEVRMRTLVENIIDGIITINEGGIIETINPAVERIFGYSRDELVGENVKILVPSPHREAHDGYLSRYLKTGEAKVIGADQEVEGRRKDGSKFPMELSVSAMVLDNQQMFTGIIRDITERKQIERLKSEFVSSVSHELRTPLTSIRGALGLIVGGAAGELPKKSSGLVEIAHNNSQRLINIVNDILDLEKIGSGRIKFRFDARDAVRMVKSALTANKGFAGEHDVRFNLVECDGIAPVRADEERIAQVMANLLSNAAKFSPKGATVDIALKEEAGRVKISVADQGPGIPEKFHNRVFDRFSQADSSDTRKAGGTGLGLSIVKTIVERHGGNIGFDTKVGVGTTFYFDLPVMADPNGAGRDELTKQVDPGTSKGRVLICEDDPDFAKILSIILSQSGMTTDIAYDAKSAKALLKTNRYDAMTVDIVLPDQDGVSMIRELRRRKDTRNLPIVIVSGRAKETREKIKTSTLGIVDWLNKPINEDQLSHAITLAVRPDLNRAGKPRLLYVEDDPDLVSVVSSLVAEYADTTIAGSISEGKRYLRDGSFDLVIVDVKLPDGSGLDLLELAKDKKGGATPVIVFSGEEIDEDMTKRIDAALVKSRTSDQKLLETIQDLVGRAARVGSNRGDIE